MYQLGDIDRVEHQARIREVQAALNRLRQRVQLEDVEAQARELLRVGGELIDLASDWRDANAQERADATQALVESVFYDPLDQRIIAVTIRQKYRNVLLTAFNEESAL
jgi:hypothetical protein